MKGDLATFLEKARALFREDSLGVEKDRDRCYISPQVRCSQDQLAGEDAPESVMKVDPIGFTAGDSNLYRYVANRPTEFTDPTGLYFSGAGQEPADSQQSGAVPEQLSLPPVPPKQHPVVEDPARGNSPP